MQESSELHAFKKQFDPLFEAYLKQKLSGLPAEISLYADITTALLSFTAAGKRLRPYIAYCAGCEQTGNAEKQFLDADSPILPLLYALELYHTFALIHDDCIDHSDTRHGVQAIHAQFGTSQAILIGDLCVVWAHECIASISEQATDRTYVSVIFSALAEETITGQMLDVWMTQQSRRAAISESMLNRSIDLKSARYTFIYPMFLGQACADTSSDDAVALVRIGRALGHAFQRLDNLADIYFEAHRLGKEPCSDFRNGVPSHAQLAIQERGTVAERGACSMLFGNRYAPVAAIRSLVKNSGAYDREMEAIATLLIDARQELDARPDRDRWLPCVTLVTDMFSVFSS